MPTRQLVLGGAAEQRPLSGNEKAAALLLALGPDYGKPIWAELDEMEIKTLSRAMVRLGPITQEMLDGLLVEFVTTISSSGSVAGNTDTTERLLLSFLPADRVDAIMEEIRGPAGRNIWEKLSNVQEDVLANYLKNEYPQTIAVVLSKLAPDHAARVLTALSPELAMEVVRRMLGLDPVQKDILEKIESTLRTEFMSTLSHTKRRDSHEQMAEIFNAFDRATEARFINALEETSRDDVDRIKALMFTFDDLVKLDAGSAQTLMRHVDKDKLGIALKSANEEVRAFFMGNMSTRAAKMLMDDMAALGPVRLRDVDEAQALLVNLAKDLAAKGEIMLSKNRADDELVY
jgi:flagellar motor switch protein FliG